MQKMTEQIKKTVLEKIDPTREIEEKELYSYIDRAIIETARNDIIPLCQRQNIRTEIFNSMKRLDILQELLDDPAITEIMINGYKDIFIEKEGKIFKWAKSFQSKEKLEDIAQKIAGKSNRIVNESIPIVDTRLEDGSRVNIVLTPVAIDGPNITIRKFYKTPMTMDTLINLQSVTVQAANFLEMLVKARYNIFVSGGTGSGKTTFLNILSNYIPQDERIITIEDSAELQIKNVPNLVRLEVKNANIEGQNKISIRDLIKTSLRMRPDRIILGEVRGDEAIDMLQAMNTGHSGSLSTGHSNNSEDMLRRLETMVLMGMDIPLAAVKGQIASAIDIIVHLGRLRDKTRRVLQIIEVLGFTDGVITLNPLFEFTEYGEDENKRIIGELVKCEELVHISKLKTAGISTEKKE